MGRSSVRWACATVVPWVLATGALVSMSADAGVDPMSGYQIAAMSRPAGRRADAFIAVPPSLLAVAPRLAPGQAGTITTTRLPAGEPDPDAFEPAPGPRWEPKRAPAEFPSVDRSRKGDSIIALRPTLTQQGRDPRAGLLFGFEPGLLPPTVLTPMAPEIAGPDTVASFEPVPAETLTTPDATGAGSSSTGQTGSQLTAAARASGSSTTGIGSTPSVPRAVALSSTTPAPADAVPVEIAAAPVSPEGLAALRSRQPNMTVVPKDENRPSYASLIDPENLNQEQRCLAEAIYFEARSEPEEGQAAVAQVVLNRVRSGLYPQTVCGVVYQNRNRKFACQFSFACEGKSLRVTEPEPWQTAVRIAREVTFGQTYVSEVGSSTHYHANYVRPFWAKRLKKMDVIGRHIFYKLRPGQT
jgi:spore germination cell wall hydrolase CwlJ-like protein